MYKIITAILMLITVTVVSQDTLDFKSVDKKTYDQYLNQEWMDLISLGKKAIKNDIDYYYLRMRIGIAYYERSNYIEAEKHFRKALEFHSSDTLAREYLYYSNLFSGNRSEARVISKEMSSETRNRLGIRDSLPLIDMLGFEAGYNNNSAYEEQSAIDSESFEVGSMRTLVKDYTNISIRLNHPINKRLDYSHAYTNLSLNGLVQTRPPYPDPPPPPGAPTPPDYTDDEQTVAQNQYYGKLKYHFAQLSDISIGLHFVNSATSVMILQEMGQRVMQTTKEKNRAFFINYSQGYSMFKLNLFASVSNLNLIKQRQITGTLYYYPFGNLNYYGATEFTYIGRSDTTNSMIFRQMLGARLYKNFWFEGAYTKGDIRNYLEGTGFLVYNNINLIKTKLELNLIWNFPESDLSLYLRYYRLENYGDNIYDKINPDAPVDFSHLNINNTFISNTITGGIKWHF